MRCDREQPLVGRNKVKNRTMKIAGPSTPTADLVRPGSIFRLIQAIESLVDDGPTDIRPGEDGRLSTDIHICGNLIDCGLVHIEGTGISLENPLVVGVLQQL